MGTNVDEKLAARARRGARRAASIALAISVLGLLGWVLRIRTLRTIVPDAPQVMPISAITIGLLAVAALTMMDARASRRRRVVAQGAALAVISIAALLLIEHVLHLRYGFETALFRRDLPSGTPGRPPPPVAISLLVLALAQLSLDRGRGGALTSGVALALGGAFVALIALAGHLYGESILYRTDGLRDIGISLHAATAIVALSVALLLSRPHYAPVRIFCSAGIGGMAARRLLLVAIAAPLVVGIAVRVSRRHGLADVPFILAIVAASSIPVALGMIAMFGGALDRIESELRESEERFRGSFEQAWDAMFLATRDGVCTEANESVTNVLGYRHDELVGRRLLDIVAPEQQKRVAAVLRSRRARAGTMTEWTVVARNGERIPVEISAKLLSNDHWLIVGRDIRDRKSAERHLARANEAERRLREQFELLSAAAGSVSDALAKLPTADVTTVLRKIAEEARKLTGARYGAIGLLHEGEGTFAPWIVSGMSEEEIARLGTPPRPVGSLGVVAREGRTVRVSEVEQDPSFVRWPPGHPSAHSFLGAPIRFRGRQIGDLYLAEKTNGAEFTDDDERLTLLLAGRVGTVIEIARLYQVEAAGRAWLQQVIDEMPDAVVIADARGQVTIINRAAQAFAYPDADGVDRRTLNLRTTDGEPVAEEELPLARAISRRETTTRRELVLRARGGREIPVLVSAIPVLDRDGALTGAVAVYQDVTPLKELEGLREQWTSIVAHDLRQPVAVISLAAQMLVRRKENLVLAGDVLTRIVDACAKLDRMINDLLDASRIEARRLTIQPKRVDFVELIRAVLTRAGAVTRDLPIELSVIGPIPEVSADPGRIEQILFNLLSNAAKYGDPGAPIRVTVEQDGGELEVSVSNRGKGIQPSELPRLFSRFERTRTARDTKSGIGLGLYITKGLIEAHGGHISIESVPEQETTFRFTLPVPRVEEAELPAESHRARRSRPSSAPG